MNTPLCLARVLMMFVCIIAFFAPCLAQQPIEPSWNGKYLSHYLSELKNPEPLRRQLAAEAIGSMGSTASAAVPDLVKLIDSKEATDRIAAALALAKIGEGSKAAIPALQKMALSKDANESKVAELAINAIEPPASAAVVDFFSSVYVLSITIALLAGSAVAFFLWKRRALKAGSQAAAKAPQPSPEASSPGSDAARKQSATEGKTETPHPAASSPVPMTSAAQSRTRVSRQLPGMETYIQAQEGPDAVKRELSRAQDEFRRLCDNQKDVAKYFNSEELTKDQERLRQLRLESDELALQHYKLEVRLKALEVKFLESLVDHGGATDPALRGRTEATIKQKRDELRTLCETPAKTSWKGDQWVSVATAAQLAIDDLRAHLASFDVTIGERVTQAPVDGATPASDDFANQVNPEGFAPVDDAPSGSKNDSPEAIAAEAPRPAE